ncbi:MAG TPA: DUF1573 domain-containing protein [Thermoanaerobaculia bacterium]
MSDEDFGTINARRGDRAREIEILRQHYLRHREALQRMTADAPTQQLATQYEQLLAQIESSLIKLNELESAPPVIHPPAPPPAAARQTQAASPQPQRGTLQDPLRPYNDTLRTAPDPGSRPLMSHPGMEEDEDDTISQLPPREEEPRSRILLIVAMAIAALAIVGWLIWRASSPDPAVPIVDETVAPVTETEAPELPPALVVTPSEHNYGVIRKGTRATRQFEINNTTDEPLAIQLQRSTCRCLFYEYAEVVPPQGKESITVTIDGSRAPVGELLETVAVTVKKGDPTMNTSLGVAATIQ